LRNGNAVAFSAMRSREERSYIQRAFEVLHSLAEEPSVCGVSEIARRLGLSRSAVHRVLQELISTGLVAYHPRDRTYRLGPAAVEFSLFVFDWLPLRQQARPALYQMRDVTEESAGLLLKMGNRYAPVDHVTSKRPTRFVPVMGQARALRYGAGGRAILAFQPTEYLEGYFQKLSDRPSSGQPYDDPAWLHDNLSTIRRVGFSMSIGESGPNMNTLAFPLRGIDGSVAAAISVNGPGEHWSEERMVECAPECLEILHGLESRLRNSIPD